MGLKMAKKFNFSKNHVFLSLNDLFIDKKQSVEKLKF